MTTEGRSVTAPGREAIRGPGKYERLWSERQERDLALARQPGGHPQGFWFDEEAAARPVIFIEGFCRHHKGEWAGQPLVMAEWQKKTFGQIFGWRRRDGTRRFRTAYLEIPRKNGKSTIAGGGGLYLLVADHEEGAEIYASATKVEQARIVWSDAAAMVKKSEELKRFAKVFRSSIVVELTGSKFVPLGANSKTLDGLNPHGNIVDELHAHKDRGVWDVLDTAMGARRQPLTLAITTAGKYDPESIGWEMHSYATKVLEGLIEDDSFFAFIAAADEPPKDRPDWYFTEEAQRQANPNWGISVKPDYLARQAQKAKDQPSFLNEYLRLHLNVWTQTVTRWLSLERWAECEAAPAHGVSTRPAAIERELLLEEEKRVCFGGLDLSSKLDLTAFGLVFPPTKDGWIDLVVRFWLPEGAVERYAKKGQRHYETWVRDGWITTTPGDVVDYGFVRAEINALAKRFKIQDIGFDPWNATQIANELQGDGLTMVEVRQGFQTLSEPSKELEAKVMARKLRHMNNPVLRFCAANAVVRKDPAGNLKPDKEKSALRIDGVVATVIGLSRFVAQKKDGPSVYETRGILTV